MTDFEQKMQKELAETMDKLQLLIESLFIYLQAREESQSDAVCSKEQIMKYRNVEIRLRGGEGNCRWYARVPLGKRQDKYIYKYIYGPSQSECYNKLRDYLNGADYKADVKKVKTLELPKRHDTVSGFYPTYMEVYRKPYVKQSTYRTAEGIYKNWILGYWGERKIVEIEKNDVKTFLAGIEYVQQRNRVRLWLSNFFTACVEHGIIKVSPMNGLKMPKPKRIERTSFTPDEEKKFVQRAKQSKYWLFFALMLYEGLRPGEAKAIRYCDVKAECIEIRQAINDFCEIDTTKTGNVRRVPIFEQVRELLAPYKDNGSKELIFNFTQKSKNTLNMEYRKILQDIDVDRVMYSLRHTFATRCAEAGISAKQVQFWMGHSDVETTLNYYTHISEDLEKANVQAKNNQ